MNFSESLEKKQFIVTSEVCPPKGTNIEKVVDEAELLKGKVAAFNVTDMQSSVMRLGSLATCHLLQERGMEPIFQLTCRDRNRISLQSDLLNAHVLGIRNVLALTGDHPVLGDHPDAKPVFDLDSVSLLRVASCLMEGKDMNGNELDGRPNFCLGAVVNPGADPIELQLTKMQKKIDCGAKYFQTQAVFDIDKFSEFMNLAQKFGVPVIGGIIILKSAGMARYMNDNIAGIDVPDKYIEKIASTDKMDRPKVAIEISTELIEGMKNLCQGVHIMALGWERHVPDLLRATSLV
jgi:methylenetetrahydrofolate reductase (NADPH)